MSAVPVTPPKIGANERLGATLALSLIVHGLLVLGVGFALDDAAPVMPTLDVILSQTSTPLTPKEADFLAAANQEGGGESEQAKRPRDSQAGWIPQPDTGLAPQPLRAQTTAPVPPPESRVVTTRDSETRTPTPEARPQPDQPDLPLGQQKVQRDAEMARLAAEIERRQQLLAKRPRRKFVSASTKEYEYAAYLRAWVARVERVGNLNYPDEARRRGLGGRLVMTVAVRRDGSIEDVLLNDSSGLGVLDQAAMRIVRLAEPFPPLPETTERVDVLHITRTWQFQNGNVQSD